MAGDKRPTTHIGRSLAVVDVTHADLLRPGRFTLLPPGFRLCFDLGIRMPLYAHHENAD